MSSKRMKTTEGVMKTNGKYADDIKDNSNQLIPIEENQWKGNGRNKQEIEQ